jgi:hypothetical protein
MTPARLPFRSVAKSGATEDQRAGSPPVHSADGDHWERAELLCLWSGRRGNTSGTPGDALEEIMEEVRWCTASRS